MALDQIFLDGRPISEYPWRKHSSVGYNYWDVTVKDKNTLLTKNIQLTAALCLETDTHDGLDND